MCGIAGAAWTRRTAAIDSVVLRRMTDLIVHRGPDAEGQHIAPARGNAEAGVALGFRRLSIIDLSTGNQPLSNEDGTVWIAFNGEIYNYVELREELLAKGHKFATMTDTEVIVHAYEEYGIECLQKFRGMFAFALWDERNERLVLARDRIGKKPLFYRQEADRLSFGSELKTLLQIPGAPREVDPQAIDLFLTYQYVPHPRTILKGYRKLPPAHYAIYEKGQLSVARYWTPPYRSDIGHTFADPSLVDSAKWSHADWQAKLRETLTDAVRLRMRSDVPLGAFLSGGIDSTIISGLMQSLSSRPILTFSIGFTVEKFDERQYAREAAKLLGTDHQEYVVEPSALDTLPDLIWHYDEPFGDSSAIPTMYLSRVTREKVTVALSGDGGDELFAGYDRYQAVLLAGKIDRLPGFVKSICGWPVWQKIPARIEQKSFRRRVKRFLSGMAESPERRYLRWIGIFDNDARSRLYSKEFAAQLHGFDSAEFLLDAYQLCPDRDFVTRTTAVDVQTYLPCDILTKVDIASMAASLEARSPFLDHHVAELAARMPLDLKFEQGRGKKILVDTFKDLLPDSIQTRKKMGFGVPIDHWFRGELRSLVEESLLSPQSLARGYFNPQVIREMVDQHTSGQFDHSYRLWNLMVLEHWHRTFLDPATLPTGPVQTLG